MRPEEKKDLALFDRAARQRVAAEARCTTGQVDDCIARFLWTQQMTRRVGWLAPGWRGCLGVAGAGLLGRALGLSQAHSAVCWCSVGCGSGHSSAAVLHYTLDVSLLMHGLVSAQAKQWAACHPRR